MKKNVEKYSVLMSVYGKENPDFLRQSMESIYEQTVPTDDFVLVCDGALNEGLDAVINEMQEKFGERLRVVRFLENRGLGAALHDGVLECRNELIARMDSDDVAVPERCERELGVFRERPELSIVGGFVAEFEHTPGDTKKVRRVPETNAEILQFIKKRNPFNHPTVMFKKQDVVEVGNYSNIKFCQDYYLWAGLLASGRKGSNVQDVLVYMREDKNTFKRRSGKRYFKIQKQLMKKMRGLGLISGPEYASAVSIRFCSSFAPNWLRKMMFEKFMRRER